MNLDERGAMIEPPARRRAIVVARPHGRAELAALAEESGWSAVQAEGFGHAHFLLSTMAVDGAVVWDDVGGPEFLDGLAWLTARLGPPPVLVARRADDAVTAAIRRGILWVTPEALRASGRLLGAMLDQADALNKRYRAAAETEATLRDREARVDRLLNMLWQTAPIEGQSRWCTQRHVLERLDEEVERCRRGGAPVSVVLGELATPADLPAEEADRLAGWLAESVASGKRRCDVAGHYGRRGFLMVLPQTTGPQALGACQRLRQVLGDPPHPRGGVHACFALAVASGKGASVPGLLRAAEERLERAREQNVDVVGE
jgi:GGDEF domain-containing protein